MPWTDRQIDNSTVKVLRTVQTPALERDSMVGA